ncbi:hypothetical protein CDAR_423251 [Caerostris darwini]|uniref:Ribosomal protein S14 n=1 Tax=Caerostris darwini TaxID=1538125 RepID=A0AAV4UR63_9ARAC|nr:hypothetical protein CDAR_423251 [Caerostris darwini]
MAEHSAMPSRRNSFSQSTGKALKGAHHLIEKRFFHRDLLWLERIQQWQTDEKSLRCRKLIRLTMAALPRPKKEPHRFPFSFKIR